MLLEAIKGVLEVVIGLGAGVEADGPVDLAQAHVGPEHPTVSHLDVDDSTSDPLDRFISQLLVAVDEPASVIKIEQQGGVSQSTVTSAGRIPIDVTSQLPVAVDQDLSRVEVQMHEICTVAVDPSTAPTRRTQSSNTRLLPE